MKIIPGKHANGEKFWALGPIAFRTRIEAVIALVDLWFNGEV